MQRREKSNNNLKYIQVCNVVYLSNIQISQRARSLSFIIHTSLSDCVIVIVIVMVIVIAPTLDVDWRDDTSFATCSTDKMIYVCEYGKTEPLKCFNGHTVIQSTPFVFQIIESLFRVIIDIIVLLLL